MAVTLTVCTYTPNPPSHSVFYHVVQQKIQTAVDVPANYQLKVFEKDEEKKKTPRPKARI